jgi:hypothetical protein
MAGYFTGGLKSTAQVLRKKLFGFGVKMNFVFRPPLPMAFVVVENVFDRLIGRAHRRNHLIAFGSLDSDIIGTMDDQQRRFDVVYVK